MLTWLADVLRDAGLDVVELDGWRSRTRAGAFIPEGVVWHHTATPRTASDATVDRLLRDGRSDLPGPLCQLGLRRSGTFVVVAAGRCNHNGFGSPWGNDSIGIEAYNDGVGEPWPVEQVIAYVKGTAAICRRMGWGVDRVKAHRETDPTRKVDPRGIDMNAARGRISALLTHAPEDSMSAAEVDAIKAHVDAAHHATRTWIREELKRHGAVLAREVRAGAVDAASLAEELATRLPSTSGPVRVTDLEEALRNVLGSLDETG